METISIIDNMNDEFVYNSSEAVKSTIEVYAPNLRRLPESEKQILFEKLFEQAAMDNPEIYSVNNEHQKARVVDFFNVYGEKLRNAFGGKEIDVLDIGSGCGTVLKEVIVDNSGLKFSKIIGVDISEEMVKFSNEKYGSDLISFQVMDAGKEIPENLKNQKFDLITSFFVFHWISDFDLAFKNVQNLLKPNGVFCCVLVQIQKETIENFLQSNDDEFMQLFDFENIPNFRLSDDPTEVIKSQLDANKMEIDIIIDDKNDEYVYDNFEDVKSSIEVYVPKLSILSESEKPEIYERLFKIFDLKKRNDKFILSTETISFIVRKLAVSGSGFLRTTKSHL
ncbi:unnamed protein product [Chironomus riparius]|nr:unnamed protein product [Chironomus riparius]